MFLCACAACAAYVCRSDYPVHVHVGMCTVGVRANANSTKVGEISVLITHWRDQHPDHQQGSDLLLGD